MAKVGINTGSAANAGDGSALRAGANIINANFDEIYEYFGDGTTLDADLAGKWVSVATGINTLSNIGIGTTNPWNALTVLGNASITGVTTSSGGFSGDITGSLTGDVYNTGISTFQDVLVSGASTITGKSTFTGIGTFSSDLYVGGNLYTLGDVTYDEVNGRNISVTGIGTIAYLGSTDLNVSGFSTFSGLSTTGSDLYIGDSLYVAKDATVTGVLTATSFGAISLPDDKSIALGNDDDLELHHAAGSNSYIKNNTLALDIRGDTTNINSKNNAVTFLKANASGLMATTGILSATTFDGSGVSLSGIVTSISAGNNISVSGATGAVTITGIADTANVSTASLNVSGVSTFSSALSGTTGSFTGKIDSGKTATGTIFAAGDGGTSGDRVIQFKRASRSTDINIQAINSGTGATKLILNDEGGDTKIGSGVTVYGTGNTLFTGNIQADGDIEVDGETDLDNLQVTGITTFTGNVNVTNASLKMTSTNAYFAPPSLTNEERNNASNLVAGAVIYNETTGQLQYYNGSAWRSVNNSAV